jgi:anti-sigma-K factor RskA
MMLPTLEQLRALAPGYLFGTLDTGERTRFEQALRSSEFGAALQAELAALQAASTPVVPVARVSRATPTSQAVRVTPIANRTVAPGNSSGPRGTGGASRAGWYAAAVASAGLAAALVFAFDLRGRVDTLDAEARKNALLLARSEEKITNNEQTLSTLLAGRGNVVLVNLNTTAPTGPGMQVFWNVRDGKAVVNAFGLAQVSKDRAYMLWMIRDGTPVPLKLFTPDESGRSLVANVEVPTSTTGITLLAVTEENASGATAPTMTPFIAGSVPAAR